MKNLTVTVSNLTDACDAGNDRLRGILFDGVSGSIMNNTVRTSSRARVAVAEWLSGRQRHRRPEHGGFDAQAERHDLTNNVVTDYQKTGIIATLSTVATITNNTVTGDGPINYIAQNGIQVSFDATAKLVGNDVSLNNYSPR